MIHYLGPASVSAHRQPAADYLSERGDVRLDFEQRLRAAVCDTETGDDLVEYQQYAVLCGDLAKRGKIPVQGRHDAHVAGDGFKDYACDLFPVFLARRRHRIDIIIVKRHGAACVFRRHPGAGRHAERGGARARLHQQPVRVAVVAAIELDDDGAFRVSAREPYRAHDGLGARADETHFLDGGNGANDHPGKLGLSLSGNAEACPPRESLLETRCDFFVGVPEYQRAPRANVIDVLLAVDIPYLCALAAFHEYRRAADALERANGTVHSAGHVALGLLPEFLRIRFCSCHLMPSLHEVPRTRLLKLARAENQLVPLDADFF